MNTPLTPEQGAEKAKSDALPFHKFNNGSINDPDLCLPTPVTTADLNKRIEEQVGFYFKGEGANIACCKSIVHTIADPMAQEIAALKAQLQAKDLVINLNDDLRRQLEESQQKLQRVTDLVRYQRAELHEAGLINDAEYAELSGISGSPARLESYDELKQKLDAAERACAEMRDIVLVLHHTPELNMRNRSFEGLSLQIERALTALQALKEGKL